MSYLAPDQAGYFEAIQVYFTEVTDRMMVFGAKDRALLERWKKEGRPARLVCRGIRDAVASCEEDDPPRSLAVCEPFVDELWEQFERRSVGSHDDDPQEDNENEDEPTLYQRVRWAVEQAGRDADDSRFTEAYRRAWRELKQFADDDRQFSVQQLEAVDEALVEAYLEALDDEESQRLEEAIASAHGDLLGGMSPAAKREHLRIKRKRQLVEKFGLLDLFEVV